MDKQRLLENDAPVEDLGAATDVTRGVWDPMLKENHIMPQARDF